MALPAHFVSDLIYGPQVGGRFYTNRLYWEVEAGSVTQTNINQLCDGIRAVFAPLYAEVLSIDWNFRGVNGYMKDSGGTTLDGSSSESVTPGLVDPGDTLPTEDNIVLRRRTGQSGRNKRGRIFITGIPELFTADAEALSNGAIALYKAIGNKMDQNLVVGAIGITLAPRQPDFKGGTLQPVTQTQLVVTTRSRRDRRMVKRAIVQGIIGV